MRAEYYFSVTSPFCYIGNQRIFDIEKQYNIKWKLKPYALKTNYSKSKVFVNLFYTY